MNTQKVTEEFRLSHWVQVIKAQHESGQNIKNFCESAGISRHKFFYWQKKLRKEACTELLKAEDSRSIVPSGWVQLEPKQVQNVKNTLHVEINGCNISVNHETDSELLKKVCHILRSL